MTDLYGAGPPPSGLGPAPVLGVDIDPFSVQVRRWCQHKAPAVADRVYRAIIGDFLARVKELTPVRTGYLRANWTVVRADASIATPGFQAGMYGDTLAQMTLADLHFGESVLVVNPAVYARRVEFGFHGQDSLGRHYNQAARGMLQQAVMELPSIARQAAQRVTTDGTTV